MFNGFKDPTNFYGNQPPFENCNQPAFLGCEGSKQTSAPPWDYTAQTYNSVSFYSGDQHMNHRLAPTIIHNPSVLPQFDRKDSSLSINNNFPYPNPNNNHQTLVRPTALINCQSSGNACCNHPSRIHHHWNSSAERYLGNTSATLSKEVPRFPQNVPTFLHDEARFRPTDSFVTSLNNLSRFARDTSTTNSGVPSNPTKKKLTSPVESCTLRQQCSVTVGNNETAEKYSENNKSTKKPPCLNCPDDCRPSCRLYDHQTITEFPSLEADLSHTINDTRENVVRHTGHTSLNNGSATQAYSQWPSSARSQAEMWLQNSHTSSWMHPEGIRMPNNAPPSSFWMERSGNMTAGTSQQSHTYQDITQYKTQGRDHQEMSRYQNATEKKKIEEFVRYETHRKTMEMSRYQENIRKKNEEGCQESQQKGQDSYGRCQDAAQYQELNRPNTSQVPKHHENRNKELSSRCHKVSRSSDVPEHSKHKGAIITHTSVVPNYALGQDMTSTFQPPNEGERRCLELMPNSNHNSRAVPPNFAPYTHNKISENYTTGIAQPPSRFSSHITYTQSKISRSNNDLLLSQVCNEPYNPSLTTPFTDFLGNNLPSLPCKLTTTNSSPINMTGKNQYTNSKSIVDFRSTQTSKTTSDVIRYGASKESLDAGLYNMSGLQSCNKMSDNIVSGKTMQVVDGPIFNVDKSTNLYSSSKTSQNHNINSPSCREIITNSYHTVPSRNENENYNIFCNTSNMASNQTSVPHSYETMLPLGPAAKNASAFPLSSSCVSDFTNHSLGENGTNRPIKKRKCRLKDVLKQDRYNASQNLKRWHRSNQHGTEPVLDVRQFLATWDEESEDLSTSPKISDAELNNNNNNNNASMYVLDCRGSETTSHDNSDTEMVQMYQQLREAHNRDKVDISLDGVTLRDCQRVGKDSTSSASDVACQQLKNTVKIVEELVESNTELPSSHSSAFETCQTLSRSSKSTRGALPEDNMKEIKGRSKQDNTSTRSRSALDETIEVPIENDSNQSDIHLGTSKDKEVTSCEQVESSDTGASMPDILNSPLSAESYKRHSLEMVNDACIKDNQGQIEEVTKISDTPIHCEETSQSEINANINSEVKAIKTYKGSTIENGCKIDQHVQHDVCSRASTPESLVAEECETRNESIRLLKHCQPFQENSEARASIPKTVIVSMCQEQQIQCNSVCSSLSLVENNIDFKHSNPNSLPLQSHVDSVCGLLVESVPIGKSCTNQPKCEPYCSILDDIVPLEVVARDSVCNSEQSSKRVESRNSISNSEPDYSALEKVVTMKQQHLKNDQQIVLQEGPRSRMSDDEKNCSISDEIVPFGDQEEIKVVTRDSTCNKQQSLKQVELISSTPVSEPDCSALDEIVSLECPQLGTVMAQHSYNNQLLLECNELKSNISVSETNSSVIDEIVPVECQQFGKVVTHGIVNINQQPLKQDESKCILLTNEPGCEVSDEVVVLECQDLEKNVTHEYTKQQPLKHVELRSSIEADCLTSDEVEPPDCQQLGKCVTPEQQPLEHVEPRSSTQCSEPDHSVSDEILPPKCQQLENVLTYGKEDQQPSSNTPRSELPGMNEDESSTALTHFNSRSTTPDMMSYASTPESILLDDYQHSKQNNVGKQDMIEASETSDGMPIQNEIKFNTSNSAQLNLDQNNAKINYHTNLPLDAVCQLATNVITNQNASDDKMQGGTHNDTESKTAPSNVDEHMSCQSQNGIDPCDTVEAYVQLSKQVVNLQSDLQSSAEEVCPVQSNITTIEEVTAATASQRVTVSPISYQPLCDDASLTNAPDICMPSNTSIEENSCIPEFIGANKNVSHSHQDLNTRVDISSPTQVPVKDTCTTTSNSRSQLPEMVEGSIISNGDNNIHSNEQPPQDYNFKMEIQQLGVQQKFKSFIDHTHSKTEEFHDEGLQEEENDYHLQLTHSPINQQSEGGCTVGTDIKPRNSPPEQYIHTASECESTTHPNVLVGITKTNQTKGSEPVASICENTDHQSNYVDMIKTIQGSKSISSDCEKTTNQKVNIQGSEYVSIDCESANNQNEVEDFLDINEVSDVIPLEDNASKTTANTLAEMCCKDMDNLSTLNDIETVNNSNKAELCNIHCVHTVEEVLENINMAIETQLADIEDVDNVKSISDFVQPSVNAFEEDIINCNSTCESNSSENDKTYEIPCKQVNVQHPRSPHNVAEKEQSSNSSLIPSIHQDTAGSGESDVTCNEIPGDVMQQFTNISVESQSLHTSKDVLIQYKDLSGCVSGIHRSREDNTAKSSSDFVSAGNKSNTYGKINDGVPANKVSEQTSTTSEPLIECSETWSKDSECQQEGTDDFSENVCSSHVHFKKESSLDNKSEKCIELNSEFVNDLNMSPNEICLVIDVEEKNDKAVPYIDDSLTQPDVVSFKCMESEEVEESTNQNRFSCDSDADKSDKEIDVQQSKLVSKESKLSNDDSEVKQKHFTPSNITCPDISELIQNNDETIQTTNTTSDSEISLDEKSKTIYLKRSCEPSDCKMANDEDIVESLIQDEVIEHCVTKVSSDSTKPCQLRAEVTVSENNISCNLQEFSVEEEMPQLEINSDTTPSDSDLLEMPYLEPVSGGVSVITEVNVPDNSQAILSITKPGNTSPAQDSQFEMPSLQVMPFISSHRVENKSNIIHSISSKNTELQICNRLKESDSEHLEIIKRNSDTKIDSIIKDIINDSSILDSVVSHDEVLYCTEFNKTNLALMKNRQEVEMFDKNNINQSEDKLLMPVSETEMISLNNTSVIHNIESVTHNSNPVPPEPSLDVGVETPYTVNYNKVSAVPYIVEHSQELNVTEIPTVTNSSNYETAEEHAWCVMSEPGISCFDDNSEILPAESVLNWPYLEEEVISELPELDADSNVPCSHVNSICDSEEEPDGIHLASTVTTEPNENNTIGNRSICTAAGVTLGANDLKCRLSWKKIFDLSKLEERKKQKTNERKQRKEASRRWPYYGKIPCKRKQIKDNESSCRKIGRMTKMHNLLRGSNAHKKGSNKDIIDGLELGPAKIEVRLAPKPFSEDHSKTWQVVDVPNYDKISVWTTSKENNNNYMLSAGDLTSKPEEGGQVPIVLVRRLILKRRTDDNTTASEESTPESGSPTTECSSLNYEEENSDHNNHNIEPVPDEITECKADNRDGTTGPPGHEYQFGDDLAWDCSSPVTNHQVLESHLQDNLLSVTNIVQLQSPHSSGNESCVSSISHTSGIKRKRKQQLPRVIIKRTGDGAAKYRSYLRVSGVDKNHWQPVVCLQRSTLLDTLARRIFENSCDANTLKINISQMEKIGFCVNFSERKVLTSTTENNAKIQGILKLGPDLKLQNNNKFTENPITTTKKVCKYVVVEKFTKDTKITIQRDKREGVMEVDINLLKEKSKGSKDKKADKEGRRNRKDSELTLPVEQYKGNEFLSSDISLNIYTKDTSGSFMGTKTSSIELRRHSEDILRKQTCKNLSEKRTKSMCLEQIYTEQQIDVNCQIIEDTSKDSKDKLLDEQDEKGSSDTEKKPSSDESFLLNLKQKNGATTVITKNSTIGRKRTLEELQKKDVSNINVVDSVGGTSQECSELKKKCFYSPKKGCRDVMRPEDLVNLLLNKSDLPAGSKDTLKQTSDKFLSSEKGKGGTGSREPEAFSDHKNEESVDATCRACGWTFEDKNERAMHIRKHPYHCQRCHLAFKSEVDFVSHLSSKHPSTREQHHCLLCERSFSTTAKHQLHLSGRMHRQLEAIQRRTIHTIFTILTGHSCPGISPMTDSEVAGLKWFPAEPGAVHFYHQATPLQMAVQDWMSRHQQMSSSARTDPSEKGPPP